MNFFQSQTSTKSDYLIDPVKKEFLEYRFREYQLYTEYTRRYMNIWDIITELGGTWSGLNLVGLGFTLAFSYNLMMSSLIRQLYFFNARFPNEISKKKKKGKKTNKKADVKVVSLDSGSDSDHDHQLQLLKKQYAADEEAKKKGKFAIKNAI